LKKQRMRNACAFFIHTLILCIRILRLHIWSKHIARALVLHRPFRLFALLVLFIFCSHISRESIASIESDSKRRFVATVSRNANGDFSGEGAIRVLVLKRLKSRNVPGSAQTRAGSGYKAETLDKSETPDKVEILDKAEILDKIETLDVDEYLRGVLPSEMPSHWPMDALKAQAVAARSYVRSVMRERAGEIYHVDDSVMHQVYNLRNYLGADIGIREKIDRAIEETKGQYLVDEKSRPYKAYYHSDCGGTTEDPHRVWGDALASEVSPSERSESGSVSRMFLEKLKVRAAGVIRDKGCALNTKNFWTTEIPLSELAYRLLGDENRVHVSGVRIVSRTPSGRIADLDISFIPLSNSFMPEPGFSHTLKQRKQFMPEPGFSQAPTVVHQILSAQDFRRIFGFNRIRSTNFKFRLAKNFLKLYGRGYGHGVGLCQHGARLMALSGSSYVSILKHYYPGARLNQIPHHKSTIPGLVTADREH